MIVPQPAQLSEVGDRIRSMLSELPAATAKVADCVLGDPQAPLHMSIGQLAEAAGTSPATVTRFCRALGYSGYVAFRVGLAKDVGRRAALDTWTSAIGRAFGPEDSPESVLSMLINAHVRTLHEVAAAVDLTMMAEIGRQIAKSSHVDIYGVGGSAMLAEELQGRLYRIGITTYAWSEVHAGLTSAAIQGSGSVAIGISTSGRTEETIQMLTEARRAGALTVAVTNNPTAPLAEGADWSVITSVHEQTLQPDDLSAKHGLLLILDLLYLLVAQENFDRASAKLAASASAVSTHRRPRRGARPTGAAGPTQTAPTLEPAPLFVRHEETP